RGCGGSHRRAHRRGGAGMTMTRIHRARRLPAVSVLTVLLGLAAACATNPVTGKRQISLMTESQEIGIGQESHPEIIKEMGEYGDLDLQRYVSDIGMRLAKQSERPN